MSTKKKTLELLEQNRGESLSGEEMAKLLDVSRNSIWKAIHSLKKEGYQIKAASNQGYTLLKENNLLSVEGMLPYLSKTDFASHIQIYDSLESTNKTAKEIANNGYEHGTVIIADTQTAGRGRYGRQFHSPSKSGLYMSFILKPEFLPFENPTTVTAFAAVAVCEAITTITQKRPQIKWVNDIFLDGIKICGILTEAMTDLENQSIQSIILGIGINFNTKTEEFPDELRQIAGSLYPDGSIPTTRNQLAAEIINQILASDPLTDERKIFEKYKAHSFILGKKINVIQGNQTYEATAIDINSAGHLLVRNQDGEVLSLSSGEVRIRPH